MCGHCGHLCGHWCLQLVCHVRVSMCMIAGVCSPCSRKCAVCVTRRDVCVCVHQYSMCMHVRLCTCASISCCSSSIRQTRPRVQSPVLAACHRPRHRLQALSAQRRQQRGAMQSLLGRRHWPTNCLSVGLKLVSNQTHGCIMRSQRATHRQQGMA